MSYSDLQESSEGLLSSAGRGVEKGSLQKHSSSSRKLGRQEGAGALCTASGSLGLDPEKSKLKDKLSAIRQDRAGRRESLQKQDAIHEVDSSEDETDEGSEDSQDGRRGTTFTPPPLLRPTTVRTGPRTTLPSLCCSPCPSHATSTQPASSQPDQTFDSHTVPSGLSLSFPKDENSASEFCEPSGVSRPNQGPLPFSTPGSAFISVSKETFLKPDPPLDSKSLRGKTGGPTEPRAKDQTPDSPTPSTTHSIIMTTSTATTAADGTNESRESPRSSCSSPGIPKEKKEADNRRRAQSVAAVVASCGSCSQAPAPESGVDKMVSQLTTVAKSVLDPVQLSSPADRKDQKPFRGGSPDRNSPSPRLSESTTRGKTEQVASTHTAQTSCKEVPQRPSGGDDATSASAQRQQTPNTNPSASAASEPLRKRSQPQTATGRIAQATPLQPDKATGKKT